MRSRGERPRLRANLSGALPVLAIAMLASGCIIEDRHHGGRGGFGRVPSDPPSVPSAVPPIPRCPDPSTTAENATIDVNDTESIQSEPGQGVGVLVDYDTGGHWHVWSVCDTAVSGIACGYAVTALALGGDPVANVTGDDLEPGETAGTACPDTAFFAASTDLGVDGVRFDATPGAAVQVQAALDGTLLQDIILFVQGGDVPIHSSNPITLTPASL